MCLHDVDVLLKMLTRIKLVRTFSTFLPKILISTKKGTGAQRHKQTLINMDINYCSYFFILIGKRGLVSTNYAKKKLLFNPSSPERVVCYPSVSRWLRNSCF